jgi:hypothetical protein
MMNLIKNVTNFVYVQKNQYFLYVTGIPHQIILNNAI